MKLPMPNAMLTKVGRDGFSAEGGRPATAGTDAWEGEEGIYFSERSELVEAPEGEANEVVARSLIVDADFPVRFRQGDKLTFTPEGGDARTAKVREVARHKHPGAPGTTRLMLEDA